MIVCVTLNAAVDRTYVVPSFTAGGIFRVEEIKALPGGKGINVARVIRALGQEVLATGLVGGLNGRFIEEHLAEEGIPARFAHIAPESRLTVTILDPAHGTETGLYERGPCVAEADWARFKELFHTLLSEAEAVVLSGSLPCGLTMSAYKELIELARAKQRYVVLDTSGGALKEGLTARPNLVKPNRSEAEELLGRPLSTLAERAAAVRALLAFGPEAVAVSCGGEGTVVGCREGIWQVKAPRVAIRSSVGAGDAFVAGFTVSWLAQRDFPAALRFATACAAANITSIGAGVLTLDDVQNLAPSITAQRLE